MPKQILFLDIDGVFSIPTEENKAQREKFGYGLFCWPTPVAYPLLRAITADRAIYPVWLSAWDSDSNIWCDKAGVRHFPIGYHLSGRQKDYADKLFPEYNGHSIDRKLIAARYYLRKYPTHKVAWIEDGFMDETREWAEQEGRVKLIDTTQDEILKLFLTKDDIDSAVSDILRMVKV